MAVRLPSRVHLPSGRVVVLGAIERDDQARTLLAQRRALEGIVRDERGDAVAFGALPLGDFHVLRAIATAAGAFPEDEVEQACDNCDTTFRVAPSKHLELAPFFDGELDDPELDAPYRFDERVVLENVSLDGRGGTLSLRLRDVTVEEAAALHDAIARPELRITSSIVGALGIEELDGENDPRRIARALQRASDDAWTTIVAEFVDAHYGPRLVAFVRCDRCGARNPVEAPVLREFPAETSPRGDDEFEGFPPLDAFETSVRDHAERLYRKLGVANVDLIVEDGVPACDDGGVPLLGSYDEPIVEAPGVASRPAEVRLYYRTFRAMWADDGPYDVSAEIAETIEHELEHHLAWLRGVDPQDELERAEIASEAVRAVGSTEALRRASRSARSGIADFFYRTWPIWLLALLGTLALFLADR